MKEIPVIENKIFQMFNESIDPTKLKDHLLATQKEYNMYMILFYILMILTVIIYTIGYTAGLLLTAPCATLFAMGIRSDSLIHMLLLQKAMLEHTTSENE